jgi:hypothetical protein
MYFNNLIFYWGQKIFFFLLRKFILKQISPPLAIGCPSRPPNTPHSSSARTQQKILTDRIVNYVLYNVNTEEMLVVTISNISLSYFNNLKVFMVLRRIIFQLCTSVYRVSHYLPPGIFVHINSGFFSEIYCRFPLSSCVFSRSLLNTEYTFQ